MKIYIPNISSKILGGGLTFRRNFAKGIQGKAEIVESVRECDIFLIAGVTITDRQEVRYAKARKKKVVLRIDNMPRDSKNRGTAFSRMRDFALMADHIIFQSEWARDYVGWWIENKVEAKAKSSIVYNGVDIDYFYHKDEPSDRKENYLIVNYNRDENKRIQEAFYDFMMRARKDPNIQLRIIGKFAWDIIKYNFDFFNNEKITYMGIVEDPGVMGNIMRLSKYFYFPAFADASSNVLTEALACGCQPLCINPVGGSIEIVNRWKDGKIPSIQQMADNYL